MGIDATTRIVGYFVSAMGVGLIFNGMIEALEMHGVTSLHLTRFGVTTREFAYFERPRACARRCPPSWIISSLLTSQSSKARRT